MYLSGRSGLYWVQSFWSLCVPVATNYSAQDALWRALKSRLRERLVKGEWWCRGWTGVGESRGTLRLHARLCLISLARFRGSLQSCHSLELTPTNYLPQNRNSNKSMNRLNNDFAQWSIQGNEERRRRVTLPSIVVWLVPWCWHLVRYSGAGEES